MMNLISRTILLASVIFLAVAGCEQEQQQQQLTPRVDVSVDKPPYMSAAIEATGGPDAWANVKKLELDCIVTSYRPDGSFYLTQQHHEIEPSPNLIRISAKEPQGNLTWKLSPDGLTVMEGTNQGDFLPGGLGAEDYTKAILDITTIPLRIIERKTGLIRGAEPVKIEGQWYYPIGRPMSDKPDSKTNRPNIVYYQNRDNSLVDTILVRDTINGAYLAVRGYNYHEVEKGGIFVPAKIEIYTADSRAVLQKRLVKIDYY
jgi:hypothetical protein